MGTVRIQNGDTENIVALFYDSSDSVLTGETITLSIFRQSDGKWYTGAAWQVGYVTITGGMTEKAQGYYEYDFDTSGLSDDTYHIRAVCSNAGCVVPVHIGEIKTGLLGLNNENRYIDNPVFDGNGNLTSARVRTYGDAGSVGTESNVIATYIITAVGDGVGKFTTWQTVKE